MVLTVKNTIILIILVILFFIGLSFGLVYLINSTEVSTASYKKIVDRVGKYPKYDEQAEEAMKDNELTTGEYNELNRLYNRLERQTITEKLRDQLQKKPTHPRY